MYTFAHSKSVIGEISHVRSGYVLFYWIAFLTERYRRNGNQPQSSNRSLYWLSQDVTEVRFRTHAVNVDLTVVCCW